MSSDPLLILTTQYFLALLLVTAAVHKATNLQRVKAVIAAYRLFPAGIGTLLATLVMGVEMVIGAGLMIPSARRPAALMAAALFAVYLTIMAVSLLRGNLDIDCGCSLGDRVTQLSGYQISRNVVLITLSLCAVFPDSGRAISWFDQAQIVAAVTVLALVYSSIDSMLTLRSGRVLWKGSV
jgi:uncharacterized membrane protein YphA (DoxX/SURF4 family)